MVNLSRTGNQVCNELQQRAGSAMGNASSGKCAQAQRVALGVPDLVQHMLNSGWASAGRAMLPWPSWCCTTPIAGAHLDWEAGMINL